MGRKPIHDTAKLGVIQVRLTPSERAELDAAAALVGLPTSTWLRDLGLNTARKNTLEAKKVTPETTAPKKRAKSAVKSPKKTT